jgi:hypothetical protein
MSKLKLASVILISVFLCAGITLAGFWFLSGKFFSFWMTKVALSNQQNNAQSGDCIFPTSADTPLLNRTEIVRQTSLKCAAFEEAKLQYDFDPNNALTWDNAFPSRENWSKRLKVFDMALRSEWRMYHNEQYGFRFDYPDGWNVFVSTDGSRLILSNSEDQLIRPMVIKITDFSTSPAGFEQQAMTSNGWALTKKTLAEKKQQLEESGRVADANGKFVNFNNDYNTFQYHNFYRQGEFFIDNNLITVIQPLSVIIPDIAGYGKEQEKLLAKINRGDVNELVSAEIKLFDLIVDSFRVGSFEYVK